MKFEIFLYTPNKIPSFYKKAIGEYEKRLARYGKISLHMIRKEKIWNKMLDDEKDGFYLVAGKSLSSETFSDKIAEWENNRRKEVRFYVDFLYGETVVSPGLSPFSISDFRINNAMTTMILYEQIYRGYRIMHHHPYHK